MLCNQLISGEAPNTHFSNIKSEIGILGCHAIKHAAHYLYIGSVEIVKIVATGIFLNYYLRGVFNAGSSLGETMIVIAPIYEEIVYRGLIQRGIGLCQKAWCHFNGKDKLSPEDRKTQQVFRIRVSALIFAASHLFLPHANHFYKLLQCGWAYFLGITYGHLSEKYSTLSITIIAHGVNNALVFSILSRTDTLLKLLAIAVNQLFWYSMGNPRSSYSLLNLSLI